LAVEDWEALGKLRESVKWTLRPRKNKAKRIDLQKLYGGLFELLVSSKAWVKAQLWAGSIGVTVLS
jgi:hypothetical protein